MRRWLGLLVLLAVAACSPPGASPVTTSPAGAKPTAVATAPGTMSPSPTDAASAAPDANVEAARLLDSQRGWVVASRRLLVTADGGSTWQDVTPPGGFGDAEHDYLLGVEFLDAQHGWVAIREDFTQMTDPSYGRIDVWRTTDGGQHWTKTQLPKAVINQFGEILPPVQFDFLDASHGFAFLTGDIAKGGNDSDLYWTADGGQTWSADRPTGHSGVEGTVAFATASDGVVVNPPQGSGVAVTHDGGRTWKDAALSLPPGSAGAQLYFGQPVFFDGRSGLVSIDFQIDTTTGSRVFRTSDAGSSWTSAATLPTGFSAVSFLDQKRWIGFNGSEVVRTVDGGATWTQEASSTPASNPGAAQFVDDRTGWDLEGQAGGSLLFATTDGGVTWRTLAPGTAMSGPSLSVSPLGTATLAPSSMTTSLATCRVESLSITGVGQGETGIVNFGGALTNTSPAACSLPGVPSSVELLGATGTPLQLTVDPALRNATDRVVLRPGIQADALLTFYWMNWCGQTPGALWVRLTFDGAPGSVTGPLHGLLLARCDYPGNPSHIQVDGIDQAGN